MLELAVGGHTVPFGLARVDCLRQVDIRSEVLNIEGEALQELLICAKDLQGPDHPDVFFPQIGRPAGLGSSHRQGFLLILYGKSEPGLSHEPPAVPDLVH